MFYGRLPMAWGWGSGYIQCNRKMIDRVMTERRLVVIMLAVPRLGKP